MDRYKMSGFSVPFCLLVAAVVCLLCFQNCGQASFNRASEVSESSVKSPPIDNGGNGGGYTGKVYVLVAAGGSCGDGSSVASEIVIASATTAILVRDNCLPVNPTKNLTYGVDYSINALDPTRLNYLGQELANRQVADSTPLRNLGSGYGLMFVAQNFALDLLSGVYANFWYVYSEGTLKADTTDIASLNSFLEAADRPKVPTCIVRIDNSIGGLNFKFGWWTPITAAMYSAANPGIHPAETELTLYNSTDQGLAYITCLNMGYGDPGAVTVLDLKQAFGDAVTIIPQ